MRLRIMALGWIVLLIGGGSLLPVFAQNGWTMVVPGGAALCARGTPYAFFTRAANPDKLLIYFEGGGACWDEATCDPNARLFDDLVQGDEMNGYSTGIFAANGENPLVDYSAVFVPYCTGDLHTGSSTATYGDQTMHYNGYANAAAALDWAFANYPAPAEVVVSGCSAGSYASIFYTPTIARRFSRAAVVQLGDAGVGRMMPEWGGLDVWGTFAHLPRGVRRTAPDSFTDALYRGVSRSYPRVSLAQYNTFNDNVQAFYFGLMGGSLSEWVIGLENSIASLGGLANFHAYTAAGGEHCITPTDRFYSEAVDGVRFRDWFAGLVAGENVPDVHCSTC
jgi:hypothetical protein